MSQVQVFTNVNNTPSVPTTFQTNNGNATPVANLLKVFANESNENNDNGIDSTGASNIVHILLTNRVTGGISTIDNTPTTALTFALGASAGVYYISGNIVAFDVTDGAGASYSFTWGVRTDGVTAFSIGSSTGDIFEEVAMAGATYALSVSGNNLVITVTGIAATDINWNVYLNYRFVG